jgi:hypothetical protein
VTTHQSAVGDAEGRVILFRPRQATARANDGPTDNERDISPAVLDLARFERPREQDNYRHRMIVNTIALAFTAGLAVAGVWIAESMAVMRKNEDCVLVGRRNCATIDVPALDRGSGASATDHR